MYVCIVSVVNFKLRLEGYFYRAYHDLSSQQRYDTIVVLLTSSKYTPIVLTGSTRPLY